MAARCAGFAARKGRRFVRNALVTCLLALAVACYVAPYTSLYDRYISVWDHAAGDLRYYYAIWVAVLVSFVLAAVVAAVLEESEARTSVVHSRLCRPLLKHRAFAFGSAELVSLGLVLLGPLRGVGA